MSTTTTAPSPPLSGGRLAVVIAGALIALLATLLLMAGAAIYWADGKKDDDGYFSTRSERFVTTTHAIASDDLDVSGIPLGEDRYGKVRLKVARPRRQAGLRRHRPHERRRRLPRRLRPRDADRRRLLALRGRATAPTHGDRAGPARPPRRTSGSPRPRAPARRRSTGTSRTATGRSCVMNADGSAGVDAGVSAGVSLPFLDDLGLWLWIAAAALLALAGALIAGARAPWHS